MSAEMKEKCYLWVTRIRTYLDDSADEYDLFCTLNVQQPLVLSRVHFASLKATSYIEVDNMAIENHPNGEFLQPKFKKPFNVEDYPMFIPFLDRKKLESHPYMFHIFAPVCYSNHWWIWVADVRKKKFYILDPYHKTYDCAIYVMKWLEIIEPQNVKKGKRRSTTSELNFASRILFHDMNCDRDAAIKGSETMRLSKLSAALLSPYCQVDSYDIESDRD
ncbi:hypothetical protein Ahy_A03g011467 [Arachis hypogaea]|uniref:Ubiquitin-like protease family profile domain-containing protein n=1 Tax=Arachis hypogaea TaxID=3818 RepID=A0A445DQT6_ARAHY|nr:hypothetical protein Ahy_A03g011467 [Arachis hypogaea]